MCFKFTVLALTCLSGLSAQSEDINRHLSEKEEYPGKDIIAAATNYDDPTAAIHAGSKYFQDIYVAMEKPHEIQFGHVSESPSEWQQRFEKIDLDNLQHQGKIRWGDKDGTYGEHYWDLNHDKPSSAASQYQPKYISAWQPKPNPYPLWNHPPKSVASWGQESKQIPLYADAEGNKQRTKREGLLGDVEFISDQAQSLILGGKGQKHGGNYRHGGNYGYENDRGKREENKNGDDEYNMPRSPTFTKVGDRYELKRYD